MHSMFVEQLLFLQSTSSVILHVPAVDTQIGLCGSFHKFVCCVFTVTRAWPALTRDTKAMHGFVIMLAGLRLQGNFEC